MQILGVYKDYDHTREWACKKVPLARGGCEVVKQTLVWHPLTANELKLAFKVLGSPNAPTSVDPCNMHEALY